MQLIQTANTQSNTAPHIAGHALVIANTVRVWTDAHGKTHFEYGVVTATRDPQICTHQGTWLVRGLRSLPPGQRRPVAYTWAHSAMFHLCCGDCGTALE